MQFDRAGLGRARAAPGAVRGHGRGLERIAAVLQGVGSNFEHRSLRAADPRAELVVGKAYDRGPAGAPFRVLADHARAVAFLLADGVLPLERGARLRPAPDPAARRAPRLPPRASRADAGAPGRGGLARDGRRLPRAAAARRAAHRGHDRRGGALPRDDRGRARAARGPHARSRPRRRSSSTTPTASRSTSRRSSRPSAGIAVDVAGFEKLLDVQRERSREARMEVQAHGRARSRPTLPSFRGPPSRSAPARSGSATRPRAPRPTSWRSSGSRAASA